MTQPIVEPNFEGEEMKIPEGAAQVEAPATPVKTVLSTTILVLLTVALIAIFVGLGYWYNLVMNESLTDPVMEEPMMPEMEEVLMTEPELSTSDEIEAIEADINNSELEELDRELDQIDAEIEAEMSAS